MEDVGIKSSVSVGEHMNESLYEDNSESSDASTDSKKDNYRRARTPKDFKFGDVLGEGSYGQVMLATEKETGKLCAIKVLSKRHVFKEGKTKYVKMERNTLNSLEHPNIIKLFYTFQDPESLFFVLELAPNGDLLSHIQRLESFSLDVAQFYTAEIISACEHMHGKEIVHRDLKPDNLLFSTDLHLKLTDFGTAKMIVDEETAKSTSFCGTAEYVSPEVLENQPATYLSDLWAVGCTLYQMLTGTTPFRAGNEYKTFQRIVKRDFVFPKGFPAHAQDLIDKLLQLVPEDRIGVNGYDELKAHPFFDGIDWNELHKQRPPRMRPLHVKLDVPDDPIIKARKEKEQRNQQMREQWKKWDKFIFDSEKIVYCSSVVKHKGLSSKKRQLILTSTPRLVYVDYDKMEQKGSIPWSENIRAESKKGKQFTIHTPSRTYFFTETNSEADKWVTAIEDIKNMELDSEILVFQ